MARVRAKEVCYLNETGLKGPDDGEFNYDGPPHDSLEYLDGKPKATTASRASKKDYSGLNTDDLKAELDKRNLQYPTDATDDQLRGLLKADDAK